MQSAAASYYDFSALASLRRDAGRDARGNLDPVAQQFEALFVQMMLKSMRAATPRGELFDSARRQGYEQMYDQQLALQLATRGGIGLAALIKAQLGAAAASRPATDTAGVAAPAALRVAARHVTDALPAARALAGKTLAEAGRSAAADERAPGAEIEGKTGDKIERGSAPRALTPARFVADLHPLAAAAAARLGVEPEVLLAQAALETGWGRHIVGAAGASSNNLFNIKASRDWPGDTVRRAVLEYRDGVAVREVATFRAYGSPAESFADYATFLQASPRYARALARAADGEAYLRELQDAGYATDPRYADKVIGVWSRIDARAASPRLKDSAQWTLNFGERRIGEISGLGNGIL